MAELFNMQGMSFSFSSLLMVWWQMQICLICTQLQGLRGFPPFRLPSSHILCYFAVRHHKINKKKDAAPPISQSRAHPPGVLKSLWQVFYKKMATYKWFLNCQWGSCVWCVKGAGRSRIVYCTHGNKFVSLYNMLHAIHAPSYFFLSFFSFFFSLRHCECIHGRSGMCIGLRIRLRNPGHQVYVSFFKAYIGATGNRSYKSTVTIYVSLKVYGLCGPFFFALFLFLEFAGHYCGDVTGDVGWDSVRLCTVL